MSYQDFLNSKTVEDASTGLIDIPDLNPMLFPFQRDITKWALKRGRAAIFADCGLGKTPMQLEWARHIPGRVLILAPLAVSQQTIEEGVKFGVPVSYLREDDGRPGIVITNYEMVEHFKPRDFTGMILDESSILKSYTGKYRTKLIEQWSSVPFRLCATATPAPNNFMELGNHAEFLGVMTRQEMLSMFFVHDGGETQNWSLKGHAQDDFWRWLASWAVFMRRPSDLGYADGAFTLPPCNIYEVTVLANAADAGFLFAMPASSLKERIEARRTTVSERCTAAASLPKNGEPWLFWCNLNAEADEMVRVLDGAVNVQGSDTLEEKECRLLGFAHGKFNRLVTKPKIAGFGMNWQHCSKMAFVGLSDSYEQFYQALRRCWRFGQTKTVDAYIITADTEGAVVANIKRKERDAMTMFEAMLSHVKDILRENISGSKRTVSHYKPKQAVTLPSFL